MSGAISAMAPDLARALSFRTWAAFFAGMGWLASAEQLGAWTGLRLAPSWLVFLCTLLVTGFLRGMAAAAARRWRNQNPVTVLEVILQRRGSDSGE